MSRKNRFQGWVASLSNGKTAFEGCGQTWDELVDFCKSNNVNITMLRLQVCGANISSKQNADGYIAKKNFRLRSNAPSSIEHCVGFLENGFFYLIYIDESRNIRLEVEPEDYLHGKSVSIYKRNNTS